MIPIYKLEEYGFKKVQDRFTEEEFSYDLFRLKKGEHQLDCTIEFDLKDKPTKQYFEINGHELKGLIRPYELSLLINML